MDLFLIVIMLARLVCFKKPFVSLLTFRSQHIRTVRCVIVCMPHCFFLSFYLSVNTWTGGVFAQLMHHRLAQAAWRSW